MLLVSDAHEMSGSQREQEFRAMLAGISRTGQDVAFLGDIMDLWIAIPRYEDGLQRDFLAWCRKEKQCRQVYFVEGNHEFFVASRYGDAFTGVASGGLLVGDLWLSHGHCIQEGPLGLNRMFIGLCKSWLGLAVLSCCPWGNAFARQVKRVMGSNGRNALGEIPEKPVRRWAEKSIPRTGCSRLCLGHFHVEGHLELPGGQCHVLPAWKRNGEIMLLNPETGLWRIGPWKEILESC